MKIILADDERTLIEPLQDLLTKRGHSVDLAFDGLEALELINRNNYEIAFLDFSLPEVTGLEIVEHIQKTKPATKTVMMTGYPLMKDFLVNTIGANEYLSKPFAFSEVEALLIKYGAKD
ncbi:MAG: hypothetical protein COT00_02845 [Candidatus Omnitrophica bacterium CG07_land_8_20_14_0_80_50_8]|nr:MAG: hypothetical protein AUJ71_03110 [Candidatus Omnitrophica bacterium CG1_02_49_16]PIU40221.1 MAG: hypothetical protein COT00_02845 [Candidatus Omnitrophica bacterium CG07_land_8_20_14_0_80_50_8]